MGTAENENPLPEGDEPHSYQYEYEDYPEPVEITGYEIVTEPQKRFEDFADSQLIGLARPRFGKRGSIEEMIRPRFGKRSEEMVKRRAGFPLFNVEVDPKYKKRALYVNNLNPGMYYEQGEDELDDTPIIYSPGYEKRGLEEVTRPRFGKRALEDMIRPRFGKRGVYGEIYKRAIEDMIRPRFGKRSVEIFDKRALEDMIRPRFGKRSSDESIYKRAIEDMIRPRFGKRGIEEMIRPRFGRSYVQNLSNAKGYHKPLSPWGALLTTFAKRNLDGYGPYNVGSLRMLVTPFGLSYVTPDVYESYKSLGQKRDAPELIEVAEDGVPAGEVGGEPALETKPALKAEKEQ